MKKSWLIAIALMLLAGGGLAWQYANDDATPETTSAAQDKSLADMAKATADKVAADAKAAAEKATAEAKAIADKAAAEAEATAMKAAADAQAAAEKAAADAQAAVEKAAADARAAAEKAAAVVAAEAKALADKAAAEAKSAMEAAAAKAKALGEQAEKIAGEAADAASKAAEGAVKGTGDAIKSLMPSGSGGNKLAPSGDKSSALGNEQQKAGIVEKAAAIIAAGMQGSPKANATGDTTQASGASEAKADALRSDAQQLAALANTQSTPKAEANAKPSADPAAPRFDVAQIDADGAAVIAGQALPGALVRLTDSNGQTLGETKTEADGSFTLLSERSLPEGESALRLETTDQNGAVKYSDETIVVSRTKNAPALVVAQTDRADRPARVLQQPKLVVADTKIIADAKKLTENTVTASGAIKTKDESLAVGAVDYDNKGRLTLQGTARPGDKVTIEVDGEPVAATTAGQDGAWRAQAPAGTAPTGEKSHVGASTPQKTGGRALRVILPFAPASLVKDFPRGRLVVVQPGNSLWRIARRTYGEGLRYTVIYAANPGQIINPNLIFPGQILHAPVARKG